MTPLVIASGSPGTGKSTLARSLSLASSRGLHLDSDLFYGFRARPIDPATPEAQQQNVVVLRALARAARAFAEGGYEVFLDGVIGPWFLPLLRNELGGGPPLAYLVLRASLDDAVERVRRRDGGGASARVRQMHRAFADLGALAGHALETSGRTRSAVLDEAREGLRAGRFALASG